MNKHIAVNVVHGLFCLSFKFNSRWSSLASLQPIIYSADWALLFSSGIICKQTGRNFYSFACNSSLFTSVLGPKLSHRLPSSLPSVIMKQASVTGPQMWQQSGVKPSKHRSSWVQFSIQVGMVSWRVWIEDGKPHRGHINVVGGVGKGGKRRSE